MVSWVWSQQNFFRFSPHFLSSICFRIWSFRAPVIISAPFLRTSIPGHPWTQCMCPYNLWSLQSFPFAVAVKVKKIGNNTKIFIFVASWHLWYLRRTKIIFLSTQEDHTVFIQIVYILHVTACRHIGAVGAGVAWATPDFCRKMRKNYNCAVCHTTFGGHFFHFYYSKKSGLFGDF